MTAIMKRSDSNPIWTSKWYNEVRSRCCMFSFWTKTQRNNYHSVREFNSMHSYYNSGLILIFTIFSKNCVAKTYPMKWRPPNTPPVNHVILNHLRKGELYTTITNSLIRRCCVSPFFRASLLNTVIRKLFLIFLSLGTFHEVMKKNWMNMHHLSCKPTHMNNI